MSNTKKKIPLHAPRMLTTRKRRGNSPPRAVDVENEREGGEKRVLMPGMSKTRKEEEIIPSSRRGCRERERRKGLSPPRAVEVGKGGGDNPLLGLLASILRGTKVKG